MYKKVDNSPGFIKDTRTGVILNTNQSDIKRKKELLEKAKRDKLELEQLKSDVAEIKDLLRQILNK
jgi:translation elongation factor EF-4